MTSTPPGGADAAGSGVAEVDEDGGVDAHRDLLPGLGGAAAGDADPHGAAAVEGDPTQDVTVLEHVDWVMARGRVID